MSFHADGESGSRRKMKTAYRPSAHSLRPLYTGGPVESTRDGRYLCTTVGDGVVVSEIGSGRVVARVKGDGTAITALTVAYPPTTTTSSIDGDAPILITAHQSLTMRYYPLVVPALSSVEANANINGEGSSTSTNQPPYLTYTRQITRAHVSPILLLSSLSPSTTSTATSAATPSLFASASADGTVKIHDLVGGFVTHVFRGHGGPISAIRWFCSPSFSSGGSSPNKLELWTGCVDTKVRCFDLLDPAHRSAAGGGGKAKWVLEGHVSAVRGLDIWPDAQGEPKWLISGARDKVVLVWDLSLPASSTATPAGSSKKRSTTVQQPRIVQTILAHESLESVGLIPATAAAAQDRVVCWTGGEKGVVRLWDALKAVEIGRLHGDVGEDEEEMVVGEDEEDQRGIREVLMSSDNTLIVVHNDQNILFHQYQPSPSPSPWTSRLTRQLIGFNDEIIDAAFLSPLGDHPDSHLALATNSALIRVYDTTTWDARLIRGHGDVVLCLDTSTDGRWLASGSKDDSARVWAKRGDRWDCEAVCLGHAESVGAVALSKKERGRFLVTASQDRTVKMWDLSGVVGDDEADSPRPAARPTSLATLRIHEKDINSLDVSPNDAFLVSGSQDKLVKVFAVGFTLGKPGKPSSGALRPLGVCKGHKRGVWSVKFSPVDRVVVSGAADRTIKLWSLDDFTCLKTFEGHTNSVLRVDFLSMGTQLVSTASDGLVKLWNIRDEECVKTLDGHEDKIWALAISKDEKTIVSGGADSAVTLWEDCTVEEEREAIEKREKEVAQEQDYNNYLNLGDYRRAIQLALAMDQPGRLFKLFSSVHFDRPTSLIAGQEDDRAVDAVSITGSAAVDQVIKTLSAVDLVRLLKFVRDWNVRAKTAVVAQVVLHAVLRLRTPSDIQNAFDKVQKSHRAAAAEAAEAAAAREEDDNGMVVDDRPRPPRAQASSTNLGLKDLLEGLLPYTDRHAARLDKLMVDSYMLDYIVGEMDGGIVGGEVIEL